MAPKLPAKDRIATDISAGTRHSRPPSAHAGTSEAGRQWLAENAEAIKSMNEWVERNGLPLAKYRMF